MAGRFPQVAGSVPVCNLGVLGDTAMKDQWKKRLLVGVGLFLIYGSNTCMTSEYEVSDTAVARAAAGKISNTALEEAVLPLVRADRTRYSVYISYPGQDRESYIYQSEMMRSASMIKVFLLAAVLEQVRDGRLSLDTELLLHPSDKVGGAGVLAGYASGTELSLDTVLRLMITESDNTATNMVIDLLGMDTINDYIKRNGYSDTVLQRKMMDFEAVNEGRENYTSVKDLGTFFSRVYDHNCVGPAEDEQMIAYLKGQTDTECFPAALPNAVIAHKTGELGGLYDDGGIVYAGDKDFILVCMTEDYAGRDIAIETLRNIARAAYAH